jgi:hypothetical protein
MPIRFFSWVYVNNEVTAFHLYYSLKSAQQGDAPEPAPYCPWVSFLTFLGAGPVILGVGQTNKNQWT